MTDEVTIHDPIGKDGAEKMSEKLRISLEAARVNARMTQPQAAESLGILLTTLLKWEKGTTVPSVDNAEKLVKLYGLQLDDVNFSCKS